MSGTVLVVEGDAQLRALLTDVFSDRGAAVVSVATGHEALAALHDAPGRIDVAILDVSQRLENVFAVADRMQACGTPFVFTIPLLTHPIPVIHKHRPVLAKPYSIRQLFDHLSCAAGWSWRQSENASEGCS